MTHCHDQSTGSTRREARDLAQGSALRNARAQLTAFDDDDLSSWLMECIESASENFLCAVAEAALAASAEDYIVIRPALLALRQKHDTQHAR